MERKANWWKVHFSIKEESIKRDIMTFFNEHVKNKFPSDSYVFDVIRTRKDKASQIINF